MRNLQVIEKTNPNPAGIAAGQRCFNIELNNKAFYELTNDHKFAYSIYFDINRFPIQISYDEAIQILKVITTK